MIKNTLTAADRGKIEILLLNCTPKQIATVVGVHKSTIYRELSRGQFEGKYCAVVAQERADERRQKSRNVSKIDTNYALRSYIESNLRDGWSPEEIAGRMAYEKQPFSICHESIYTWIYQQENCWRQYLRQGRKRRKKHTGRTPQRIRIPNRISIHERPNIANVFGHFEGDSVICKNGVLTTANERVTGMLFFRKQTRKEAEQTAQSYITIFSELPIPPLSCTVDNGTEGAQHEKVTRATKVPFFFADPYSSWQRGANENGNGLLRRYIPKRYDISDLTQEELDEIATELNNRPRKRLGYMTPIEKYEQLTKLINICRNQF